MINLIYNAETKETTEAEMPDVVCPDMLVVVEQPTVEDRLDAIEAVVMDLLS